MAGSIAAAVARFKAKPAQILNRRVVEAICRDLGHGWRDRELDPFTTVSRFIQQVCYGNISVAELLRLNDGAFSESAYCQARMRLPLEVLEQVSRRVHLAAGVDGAHYRWRGHRTFIIDGSSFSMPDTPALREFFGLPGTTKDGCGFPASHLLVLFDAKTGLFVEQVASKLATADLTRCRQLHAQMSAGDILLGDEHFGSWAHLALLISEGKHGLFPINHRRIVDFTPRRKHASESMPNPHGRSRSKWIASLGTDDQLVQWPKPKTRPAWLTKSQYAALPAAITVRELRRTVSREGSGKVTLLMVTTLVDSFSYPAAEITDLRMQRWNVETDLGHLKTTMKMDVLRCETVQGVLKELAVFRLVYNLVRVVMLEAARRQKVDVKRISFADALYYIRHARPGDAMPTLKVNPERKDRIEPRAKKRRPKVYDRLNKPRQEMRNALKNKARVA
jgi:Transposase DDE domain